MGTHQQRPLDHGFICELVGVENESRKLTDMLYSKLEQGAEPRVLNSGILRALLSLSTSWAYTDDSSLSFITLLSWSDRKPDCLCSCECPLWIFSVCPSSSGRQTP